MKVLLVGSGGREHALTWKLAQSDSVSEIVCAPGNPGMAKHAEIANVDAEDVDGILTLATEINADLVVVGPEAPLVDGLTDDLSARGITTFGPSAAAARIEGSKSWGQRFDVPLQHSLP